MEEANIEEKKNLHVRDLLITAFRSRPDIIIGEVRGAEAYELMKDIATSKELIKP